MYVLLEYFSKLYVIRTGFEKTDLIYTCLYNGTYLSPILYGLCKMFKFYCIPYEFLHSYNYDEILSYDTLIKNKKLCFKVTILGHVDKTGFLRPSHIYIIST